jgi:hypothetical protein
MRDCQKLNTTIVNILVRDQDAHDAKILTNVPSCAIRCLGILCLTLSFFF